MLYGDLTVDYFKNLTEHVHCSRGRRIYSFLIRGVPIKFSSLSVSVYVLYIHFWNRTFHYLVYNILRFLWFSDSYLKTT